MKQLILLCIFASVCLVHAQDPDWRDVGGCNYYNGNCGRGDKTQQCATCVPSTRIVKCWKYCNDLKEDLIEKHEEAQLPVDVEFNSWGQWSDCSSSCGLGEQMQTRLCKAGPGNCTGDATRTQSCTPVGKCVFQSCDDVPTGANDENFEQCNINSRRCGNWRMMHAEWKIGSGQTKTKGTGPNYDNTFKKECGKYVYFDPRSASSKYKELRMITPITTTATSCLSFSLSMFSKRPAAMGDLIVKILGSENTLYNRDGRLASRRQGWEHVNINVPKGSNFLIVFAAKSRGWESDIAIDDIILTENEECEEGVDGNWAEWRDWSDCDPSCGSGEKLRMRTCTSPAPTNEGVPCIGHSEERELCKNLKPCPVNGKWSRWGSYSICQQTCGDEYQIRTRACEDRAGDGEECVDGDGNNAMSEYQSRKCNLPECIADVKCKAGQAQDSSTVCPNGWLEFRVDRGTDSELSCYKFSDTMVTYNQAKTACNNAEPTKAYLTSILTHEEQEFLLAQSQGDFFNGARGRPSGGNRWTDGKAFLYNNVVGGADVDCSYTDKTTGEWNTHSCDSGDSKHYVCKAPADLWNPWSAFSECSGSCVGAEGVKVRSRTCGFPREGYPFECIPLDSLNIVKKNGVTSEIESLPCTSTDAPECPTQATTTTAAPLTYSWLEWSTSLELDTGSLVQVRACDGAKDGVACEETGANMLYSDDGNVQLQSVSAECGEGWTEFKSSTGETTCWHHSVNQSLVYEEARDYCMYMQGQIASIISHEEQSFVMAMLPTIDNAIFPSGDCPTPDDCSYWIGAVNASSLFLKWAWEDGTPMGYSYFDSSYVQESEDTAQGLVLDNNQIYKWVKHQTNETKEVLCKKFIFQKRECQDGWYRVGDECFDIVTSPADFDGAVDSCGDGGATLASITSLDAQVFIQQTIVNDSSLTDLYIGGKFVFNGLPDSADNITGLWMDGTYWTPFNYFGGAPNGGIPDDAMPGDCISTSYDNWLSQSCDTQLPFICKYPLVPEPECPEEWERLMTPNGLQCYYVGNSYATEGVSSNHEHAIEDCESRGADLAKLDQDYERSFAIYIAEKSNKTLPFWIGISLENGGTMQWTDGEEVEPTIFFSAGFPTSGCGEIKYDYSGFELNRFCTINQHFICQRNFY